MKLFANRNLRSLLIKAVVAVAAVASVAATVSHVAPTSSATASKQAWYDFILTASINQSNTTIGISDSDLYHLTPQDINTTLDALQAIGVTDIRVSVPWNEVQPASTQTNWDKLDQIMAAAAARDMGVLATFVGTPSWAAAAGSTPGLLGATGAAPDPTKFAAFANAVATRYTGKISAYEIWNEPNGALFYSPISPEGYAALLQAAYPAIKAGDPNALVVGGVVGSASDFPGTTMNPVTFISRMYAAGAKNYFDALSYHPYEWTSGLDAFFGSRLFSLGAPYPNSPLNQLIGIRNIMVANGDSTKLIWASEYGQSASAIGETAQAQYVADLIDTWKTLNYTGPVFIHTTRDAAVDPFNSFGIFRLDWSLKPTAGVIEQAINGSTGPLPAPIDPITAFVQASVGWGQALLQPSTATFFRALALSNQLTAAYNTWVYGLLHPTPPAALAPAAAPLTEAATFAAADLGAVDRLAASTEPNAAQQANGSDDLTTGKRSADSASSQQLPTESSSQSTTIGQGSAVLATDPTLTGESDTTGTNLGTTASTDSTTTSTSTETTSSPPIGSTPTMPTGIESTTGADSTPSVGSLTSGQRHGDLNAAEDPRRRPHDPFRSGPRRSGTKGEALSPSTSSAPAGNPPASGSPAGSPAASTSESTATSGS
jgi:hypothetical protein